MLLTSLFVEKFPNQRILKNSNVVGSDNSSLVNLGFLSSTSRFPKKKSIKSSIEFQSNSGSNPPSGDGPRSSQKSSTNSHLYCDYCNWKGHVRSTCYKLHGYPADLKGEMRTTNGLFPGDNFAGTSNGNSHLMQYPTQSTQGPNNSSHGSTPFRPTVGGFPSTTSSHAPMSNHYDP
ncbi:hypothetical protein H5410_036798 [Solanum commersonii]|uniref:Uncharacterized protein n=1 Tax=Solanum commersonii TaxID=4109 RepID=A0A9J5Y993_SOLCO|nr:hypothetical protein H5410_036798 [Solanum commersonii]